MKNFLMMLLVGILSIITTNTFAQGTESAQVIRVYLKDSVESHSKIVLFANFFSINGKIYHLNMRAKGTAAIGEYEIIDFIVKSSQQTLTKRFDPFILVETQNGVVFKVEREEVNLMYAPLIELQNGGMMMDGEHKIHLSEEIKYGSWYVVTEAVLQDFVMGFTIKYKNK